MSRDCGLISGRDKSFSSHSKTSGPVLGATQSAVQLIPGPLSPGAKQSGREAAHKNELSDISTTIYALMAFTGAAYLDVMA